MTTDDLAQEICLFCGERLLRECDASPCPDLAQLRAEIAAAPVIAFPGAARSEVA